MYCLELRIRGAGLVSLRDGAYSRFDRSNVVDVFSPTQGLKAFLSKYVDESAVFRRRSQSEDDNPPSPVSMEIEGGGFLGHHRGPQSPAQQREPGLRFNHPATPPSGSNPHTPASPHTSGMSQPQAHTSFGSSPATSFSPTSLSANINPSPIPILPHPSPSNLVANSPLNPHVPSPGGLLSNPSPGPVTNLPGHSPVSSFMPGLSIIISVCTEEIKQDLFLYRTYRWQSFPFIAKHGFSGCFELARVSEYAATFTC